MIKWIFFDIGGTLVDETLSIRRRVEMTAEMQTDPALRDPELLLAIMQKSALAGGSYFRGAMQKLGVSNYPSYDAVGERLFPYTLETLRTLSKTYKLGIIANQPAGTEKRLTAYGIREYFAFVLSSAEEGLEKPAPELFLRALARAGCSPEEVVMVGDRPDNDIAPANALGMKTVRVTQGLGGLMPILGAEMRADITIEKLSELPHVLEQFS